MLKINEFCAQKKCSRTKAYQELKSGRLKAVKIGRATRIPQHEADAWEKALQPYGGSSLTSNREVEAK